ncbi:DNA-3-methyladenine glycosylase family protein [Xanthomonas maliensis]|uniref:DNA-3-methyladenine glycosylase family protein n=1 Tax=Xanthomonas maliensis TaxID=1321368 RepID=UPI0003AA6BCB|nr:DNA-3-methyladenine glycosylase [Xanthomonas maliensis]KAB7764607.1 DNA-3-methyladenine glycosylase 2 family protein [Xanthomonas maliensis]
MPHHARGFDVAGAYAHLARRDRALAVWMRRIGPLAAPAGWRSSFDPVDALARAILFQQLSGKAAATIVGRVEAAIGARRLHADTLGRLDDVALRACGVSANKTLALRDLTRRELQGEIPSLRKLAWMDDEAIVQALLPVRGIGRWTVEMMLMFRLGRPDLLPIDDLGIRKGAQRVDDQARLPTPLELAARGERWAPYRSYAALYLWRIADFAAAAVPTNRSQD